MYKVKSKKMLSVIKRSLVLLLVFGFTQAVLANSCKVPSNLKTWDYYAQKTVRSGKDWKNNVPTDYWQLVYSWSPSFCYSQGKRANRLEQCRQGFGLIVHGLWAQSVKAKSYRNHPRNCKDMPAINRNLLKENFCLMPDVKLMQKEWEKHGSCDFNKPDQYFDAIQSLNAQLTLPDKKTMTRLQKKSSAEIASWLVKNNKNIKLKKEYIKIQKKGKYLKDISFCYDLNFNFRNCKSKQLGKKKVKFSAANNAAPVSNRSNVKSEKEDSWLERFFSLFE